VNTVHVAFTKWGGGEHWTFDGVRLGEDEHGTWIGCPPPLVIRRPGAEFRFDVAALQLFPHDQYELYVDIATPAVWSGDTVTSIDLDLDVVRRWDGTVEVLDEDEFDEHRIELGYPAEVVELARRSCADVTAEISAGREPFRSVYREWLNRVG
jgi:protein associated with RNAse G/E